MSEQFRPSVTDCFSSCTASLGVFLQVKRGFSGLCAAIQESRTGKAELQGDEQGLGTLVEKGHHTHRGTGAGIHLDHPPVTRRVPLLSALPSHSVSKPKKWGFLAGLLSGNIFGSHPNCAILCGKR